MKRSPRRAASIIRPVARIRDFVDEPFDRYVTGSHWISFHLRGGVAGLTVWGAPMPHEMPDLIAAMPTERSPLATRLPRYLDMRGIATVDAASVATFSAFITAKAPVLREIVSRAAIVHDGGLAALLVTGFNALAPLPFVMRTFEGPIAALQWLGVEQPDELAAQLDSIRDHIVDVPSIVRDVRLQLAADLTTNVAAAARALGVAPRSLQRKLRDVGTSFQREQQHARVAAAKLLLERSTLSIREIAREVRCKSPRHFAELFRKLAGTTPREWRARGG
jgi:AraC-like DNA-binding protein